jgi:hypothetical protein
VNGNGKGNADMTNNTSTFFFQKKVNNTSPFFPKEVKLKTVVKNKKECGNYCTGVG